MIQHDFLETKEAMGHLFLMKEGETLQELSYTSLLLREEEHPQTPRSQPS